MPYRRLPKTDSARLRAMHMAVDANVRDGVFLGVPSHHTYHRVKTFHEAFCGEVGRYRRCVAEQASKRGNERYETAFRRARMYVSHFVQVLSMSIIRGEIARSKRSYYGLPQDEDAVPPIATETALLEWGARIMEGERRRLSEGGVPIYNPTMGRMSVEYDTFKELYMARRALQQRTADAQRNLAAMRPEADAIILDMWNEIEQAFATCAPDERMARCASFGIIYYTRTDRKKTPDND